MPLDHILLHVPASKLDELVNWLIASLGHAGFKEFWRPAPTVVGMGDASPYFWLVGNPEVKEVTKSHIAFTAETEEQVQQFHAAGLKAGGIDNGGPGLRPQYYDGYYGAFVLDPACGINFEMVLKVCPENHPAIEALQEKVSTQTGSS